MNTFYSKIVGSIRAKVWLCVVVAFCGFILAALASFRFTGIVSQNLTELQEIDFKVAMGASYALSSFKEQTKLYEDAFLTGEQEKVDEGNKLSGTICSHLHQMSSLIKRSRSLYPADLEKLHSEFKAYAVSAAKLYQNPGAQNIAMRQQELQSLGQTRMKLLKEFEDFHRIAEAELEKVVKTTRNAANRTNAFIIFLFVFVFIVLIILVNGVANRLLIKPLLVVNEAVRQLARGDLTFTLSPSFRTSDEIGKLGVEMTKATGILKSLVVKVSSSSGELADVTEEIEKTSLAVDTAACNQGKQLEKITIAVNKILESIANISQDVDVLSKAAIESSSTIQETAVSNSEVASNADNLFHAVEEVKTSITAMTASIRHVADFACSLKTVTDSATLSVTEMDRSIKDIESATAETALIALELKSDAEVGKDSVDAVITAMKEIKTSSRQTADAIASLSNRIHNIRGIISTINDFMSQTNLLALNAAIIAAQSGKSGKSFAVVADEIRKLSISTAASADQIKNVIGAILAETEQSVAATKRALTSIEEGESLTVKSGEALRKIVTGVEKSADRMGEIACSTVEQAKESAVIKNGMTNVMSIVEKIAAAMTAQQKGGDLILAAAEQMYSQTAQVHNSTMEQSKASKEIALMIESITGLISDIKFSCDFQVEESETIVTSLTDIRKSNRVNLDSTQTLNIIVAKLAAQVAALQQEIRFFSTTRPEEKTDV